MSRFWDSKWLIIVVAALVRLVYLIQYQDSPFFKAPVWDAEEYRLFAAALSKGSIPENFAYRPPLYPVFLGIVFMLFGQNMVMPRLIQIAIGIWSCVLVKNIADKVCAPPSGAIAGLLCAVCGMMVYYDLELLPTSLFIFLMLLFIYELIRLRDSNRTWLKTGVYLGMSALARPTSLPLAAVAWIWLWIKSRSVNRSIVFTSGLAFVIVISWILHLALGSGPVAISSQGGVNFYIGNHKDSDGITASLPEVGSGWGWDTIEDIASRKENRKLNESEVDNYYWRQGFRQIALDPLGWFSRLIYKGVNFWNIREISSNRDLYYHRKQYPLINVLMYISLPVTLPLSFLGIALGWKNDRVKLLAGIVALYFLIVIAFFVNTRFRHPVTPLLFILAGGGVVEGYKLIKQELKLKKLIIPLIAFIIGIILPHAGKTNIRESNLDYGLFTEARVMEKLGRMDDAERLYMEALEQNPNAPYVNFYLGELEYSRGNLRGASRYYKREIEIQPNFSRAWNNLGVTYIDLGETNAALNSFKKAISIDPGLSEASSNIARIWARRSIESAHRSDWRNAKDCALMALKFDNEDPLYKTLYFEAKVQLGDTSGVRKRLEDIIKEYPNFKPAIILKNSLN